MAQCVNVDRMSSFERAGGLDSLRTKELIQKQARLEEDIRNGRPKILLSAILYLKHQIPSELGS